MLKYTLKRMLEQGTITLERNQAVADEYGAYSQTIYQPHLVLKGLFWWWPTHGSGRGFKEQLDDWRSVLTLGGGILLPHGTDVVANTDRVGNVVRRDGLEITGPIRIVSVRTYIDHMELGIEKP